MSTPDRWLQAYERVAIRLTGPAVFRPAPSPETVKEFERVARHAVGGDWEYVVRSGTE